MKMLHCGAISGTIDRTRAPAAPAGGTPAAGATPPVHDLNVPYEATSEEYATPTADMLFPPVSSTKSPLIFPHLSKSIGSDLSGF
jgi:transcription initiation factor TFIIA large subunit